MAKQKKVSVMIEVETDMKLKDLKEAIRDQIESNDTAVVIQIQANLIKPA